jgi:hypothetical protein
MAPKGNPYQVTTSGLRAALGNVAAQAGAGKARPKLRNVQRVVGNPTGAARQVRITRNEMRDLTATFGTGLAASIRKQYTLARAGAEEGVKVAGSQATQYATGKKTAADTLKIFAAGKHQQAAAAALAMSQQLQSQTNASDSQAAAFAADIMMAEIAQENALEMAQFQHDLAVGDAAGDPQNRGFVEGITADVPTITTTAAEMFRTARDDAGGDVTQVSVTQLAQQYASEYGADQPSIDLFTKVAANIKQGMNAGPAMEAAMQSLYGQNAGKGWYDNAVKSAVNTTRAATAEAYKAYKVENPDEPVPVEIDQTLIDAAQESLSGRIAVRGAPQASQLVALWSAQGQTKEEIEARLAEMAKK